MTYTFEELRALVQRMSLEIGREIVDGTVSGLHQPAVIAIKRSELLRFGYMPGSLPTEIAGIPVRIVEEEGSGS